MTPDCPYCLADPNCPSGGRTAGNGSFYRRSGKIYIRRYYCSDCERSFSTATFDPCFGQKKRHLNDTIRDLLASSVSQRRIAELLKINRKTVVRKFLFIGAAAMDELIDYAKARPVANEVFFDDLETFEHTKLKPLSVCQAVDATRRVLAVSVAQMPSTGLLAKKSVAKYGARKDLRSEGREEVFQTLLPLVSPTAVFRSDQNPHYPATIKKFFPLASHATVKGKRGAVTGQGELKKIGFDPIFPINHTFAMDRANVNRLVRKTWCTTKKPERLRLHLALFALYHNRRIDRIEAKKKELAEKRAAKVAELEKLNSLL